MWTIRELKEKGKQAFKINYWRSVLCALIISAYASGIVAVSRSSSDEQSAQEAINSLTSGSFTPEQVAIITAAIVGVTGIAVIVGLLLKIFLINPLTVGAYGFFRDNNIDSETASLDIIKDSFNDYGRIFITLFLRDLFLCLWSCLFLIPGLVKSYSYRMVPFILRDNPELSGTEAITRSREMMNGYKWKAFVFDLSFIGWKILGGITLGLLNIFWTNPYQENANAVMYLKLSGQEPEAEIVESNLQ